MGFRGRAVGVAVACTIALAACGPGSPSGTAQAPGVRPTVAGTTAPAATADPSASQDDAKLRSDLDKLLRRKVAADRFSGVVLVARGDQIILAKAYGLADAQAHRRNTRNTRFRIASLTKQFTAMAILQLQEQGKLRVSDPVCQHLTSCPPAWEPITVHQLLTHTSGLPSDLDMAAPEGQSLTPDKLLAKFSDLPLEFAPGTSYTYSNAGYLVAGAVIEKASGQPYGQYLRDHILGPLGMSDTGAEQDPSGLATGYGSLAEPDSALPDIDVAVEYSAGSLYSTVDDLFRWEMALAHRTAPLSADSLATMLTGQVEVPDTSGMKYGYGVEVGTSQGRALQVHTGGLPGFSSWLERYPDQDITIIALMNAHERTGDQLGLTIQQIEAMVLGS